MRPIPPKLKQQLLNDPYYKKCAREGKDCDGRITFEHAFIYAGKQINERWAILPICAFHHSVDFHQDGVGLQKEINQLLCLRRATDEDLAKYPRKDWKQVRTYLETKYPAYR